MPKTPQVDKPVILALMSDSHGGSTVGLCPPIVNLADGDSRKASPEQRWMWRNYLNFVERVHDTAAEHNTGYTVIHAGDAVEGNHHRTVQVITANETSQVMIAIESLKPLLQDADRAYFIRGTPAHVGQLARLEELIGMNYHREDDPRGPLTVKRGDSFTWRILHLDANGTRFNIAHHGRIGRRKWTKTNQLAGMALEAEINGYRRYGKAPHVVIRAHNHTFVDSADNFPVRIIGMPAWQLCTEYIDKFDPDALADIGGLIFTCWPGGKYELETVRYAPKPTPLERIRS